MSGTDTVVWVLSPLRYLSLKGLIKGPLATPTTLRGNGSCKGGKTQVMLLTVRTLSLKPSNPEGLSLL